MKRSWWPIVVLVVTTSCTSQPPVAQEPHSETVLEASPVLEVLGARVVFAPVPLPGVASNIEVLNIFDPSDTFTRDNRDEPFEREAPLVFELTACGLYSDRHFGFEATWSSPADIQLPVPALFSLSADESGQGMVFVADLEAEGDFALIVDVGDMGVEVGPDSDSEVSAVDANHRQFCELSVPSEMEVVDAAAGRIEMATVPEMVVEAPAGSVQALANVDTGVGHVVRNLLLQVGPDTDLFPDRFWLVPEGSLRSANFQRSGTCWRLHTNWTSPEVDVRQTRDCNAAAFDQGPAQVAIDDPFWDVVVVGEPDQIAAFAELAVALPVAGVDALAD